MDVTSAEEDGYSVDDLTRAVLVSTRVTAKVGPDLKGEV